MTHYRLLALTSALLALAPAAHAQSTAIKFTLDPTGAKTAKLGYFPVRVPLTSERPAGIVREPVYRGAPQYATVHVGNGPNSTYFIAVDEPANGDYHIFFDKNRDGDLTNDGDGSWSGKRESNGRTMYGLNEYVVRASWGTAQQETASGDYGLAFYRFVVPGQPQPFLLMFREAARVGEVTVDGKRHKALLVENDADGLYSKPVGDDGKPLKGAAASRPVWLLVDYNDDGAYGRGGMVDVRKPFKLGDKTFEAKVADDGSEMALVPTTRQVAAAPKEPETLKPGTVAPEFTAEAYGGGHVRLSEFKGKVLILDFWATWCGPCQRSMPHVEKVYRQVHSKGIAVLGVATWDDKTAYEKWVPDHKVQYTFRFAFDPAGREGANSIATKLYGVSGIPTTYVIDRDGKVAAAIVGYDDGDTRLEQALAGLGVKLASEK